MTTQHRLKQLVEYNPSTGLMCWKVKHGKVSPGDVCGFIDNHGYWRVRIDEVVYQGHRLAWLYVNGSFPQDQIDHINGIKTDNRIENLRNVNHTLNAQNIKKARDCNKSTGILGAYPFRDSGRFVSYIRHGGKKINLGYFASAGEAGEAYLTAKRKLHEGNTL